MMAINLFTKYSADSVPGQNFTQEMKNNFVLGMFRVAH